MSTTTPAPKKRRASAAPSAAAYETIQANERVEFRRCINDLARCKQAFTEAVEKCQAFEEETLENLNLQITEKKAELAELQTTYAVELKNAQIKLAQDVAENKYKAATEILTACDEIAVQKSELADLRAKVAQAAQTLETEVAKVRDAEKSAAHAQLGAALKSKDLENKASLAELTAVTGQQKREIEALQAQIQHLLRECEKQRELTKSVADAGRQGAISQTIGKV